MYNKIFLHKFMSTLVQDKLMNEFYLIKVLQTSPIYVTQPKVIEHLGTFAEIYVMEMFVHFKNKTCVQFIIEKYIEDI